MGTEVYPFGFRAAYVQKGSTIVHFLAPQTFQFRATVTTNVLRGADRNVERQTRITGLEGTLTNGGIPLEAFALMTGSVIAETGSGSTLVQTLPIVAGQNLPDFKLVGKALTKTGDVWAELPAICLTQMPQGSFGDNQYLVSQMNFADGALAAGETMLKYISHATETAIPVEA